MRTVWFVAAFVLLSVACAKRSGPMAPAESYTAPPAGEVEAPSHPCPMHGADGRCPEHGEGCPMHDGGTCPMMNDSGECTCPMMQRGPDAPEEGPAP